MSNINDLRGDNSPEAKVIIELYDDAIKQDEIAHRGDSDLAFEYWGAVIFTLKKVAYRIIKEREKS